MKEILIINGHPRKGSFSHALADHYAQGVQETQVQLRRIDIGSLDFDPNLAHGYHQRTPWEPDLEAAMANIKRADHLVWIFPIWWYGYPAIMKGFIDRTFLPGIAFRDGSKALPERLFCGKSARIIATADTPLWYNRLVMRNPAINQLKRGTLHFSGIRPVRVTYISPIKGTSDAFRQEWLEKVYRLGKAGK
ncbi:MAG: NAD(P)H-dependent oxidoreductase [Bacteroidota bacterium]